MRTLGVIRDGGAELGGHALSVLINRIYGRGGARPLHPDGEVFRGTWSVTEDAEVPVGVAVCDQQGTWTCVVRRSRAIGLPAGTPDIEGIAVHLDGPSGGDLLLAGTGSGRVSRHLLLPRVSAGTCSTLVPMATGTGPLLLRLTPRGTAAMAWELSWSRPGGRWHTFGSLTLDGDAAPADPFDPVDELPRGLSQYRTMALLRRPSYVQAARQRSTR
jgi:hypothetical protein